MVPSSVLVLVVRADEAPQARACTHPEPHPGTFAGIALWLAPPSTSDASALLTSLVTSLASKHSSPDFSPHVTLLTGIPTAAPVPQLVTELNQAVAAFHLSTPSEPSLPLAFTGLATRHSFFQYVLATVDPSAQLLALRKAVRDALLGDGLGEDDFFPHLSLAYGEDDEGKTAEAIIQELGQGRTVGGVDGFAAEEILIVSCEGPPATWRVVGKVPLGVPA